MKKLEIEIPNNKEIDWEASAKQKQIIFKDKQLTYENVCKELFKNGYCYIDACGRTKGDGSNPVYIHEPNNAKTTHQLDCILAKNKLANIARYLNGEWSWKVGNHDAFLIMDRSSRDNDIELAITVYDRFPDRANVLFKSKEAAQQAIEILGEKTIKLALAPLY